MNSEPKNYEIAYLLSPSLTEEGVLSTAGKLSAAIQEINGTIRKVEEPRKRLLSYAIKKEKQAFFGWTNFSASPSAIEKLIKKLKEESHLLRYLLIEEDPNAQAPVRRYTPRPSAVKSKQPIPSQYTPPDVVVNEEKLDLEALDKKLEEILGK